MSPNISPARIGDHAYDITESKALIVGFNLSLNPFNPVAADVGTQANVSVFYPNADPNDPAHPPFTPTITLVRFAGNNPTVIHLAPTPGNEPPPPGYSLDVEPIVSADGSSTQFSITFTNDQGVNQDPWELRVQGASPIAWHFTTSGGDVTFLASDPVAHLREPTEVFEQDPLNVTADNAIVLPTNDPSAPATLVGAPHPAASGPVTLTANYTLSQVSGPPLPGLSTGTPPSTNPSFSLVPPVLYDQETVSLRVTSALTDTGLQNPGYAGILSNTSAAASTDVVPRAHQLVVVLDRSGSMGQENKYENAKMACRTLVSLFAGLRQGTNANDGIAIVAFEDNAPDFHGGSPSNLITRLLPPSANQTSSLASLPDALAAMQDPAFDFGVPGTNTPIGDGVLFGLDLLAAAGPIDHRRKCTLVLLTDGLENCGTTTIGDNPRNGAITFTQATSGSPRSDVLGITDVFAIALGSTTDVKLLSDFANKLGHVENGRSFQLVADPPDLATAFAAILDRNLGVNTVPATLPQPQDPDFPTTNPAVYFTTDPSNDRLELMVLPLHGSTTFGPTDVIQLARLDGDTYKAEPFTKVDTVSDRGALVLNLPAIAEGHSVHWRVLLGDSPLTASPLDPKQVLCFVDLHLVADAVLDKPSYLTGDRIVVTVRVRQDAAPILGATVTAVLTAPDVGVGEELAALGAAPTQAQAQPVRDNLPWLERRIGMVLAKHEWRDFPTSQPSGSFIDGTNQLFDTTGTGAYTNIFDQTFKEGTYSWQITVTGTDLAGEPFARGLTVATVVAVRVDPRATKVVVTPIPNHPSGLRAARVVITPQDRRHERLGPGKDNQVFWALRNGTFEHIFERQPAPVETDGTYQRVVLFEPHQHPVLRVNVTGVELREIDIRRSLQDPPY